MATPIPANHAPFTPDQMARATGGTLVRDGAPVIGVSTDTRTLAPGAAFVALTGERFDGHAFLADAAAMGATAFVVSRDAPLPARGAVVRVDDGARALGALAAAHRRRWAATAHADGARVLVAIGGSAGKTTTTRCIALLLDALAPGQVHATRGNLNNQIGVPMTLLGLGDAHRFAVVEVGTNHPGEVAALGRIAAPDVAVVTLIDHEHTEHLGSLEQVADEEGDLFGALGGRGIAVANGDDPLVVGQLARAGDARRVRYGFSRDATHRIASRAPLGIHGSRLVVACADRRVEIDVPLIGEPPALAATAAIAVAESVTGAPVDGPRATAALRGLLAMQDGRLAARELSDGTVLVDDSYNANPASVRAAIAAARELADALDRRLVLVLGEMRELGSLSAEDHDALVPEVVAARPDAVLGIAGDAVRLVHGVHECGIVGRFVGDSERAVAPALSMCRPGDVVLVKGSRGVRAERVVDALVARAAQGGGA